MIETCRTPCLLAASAALALPAMAQPLPDAYYVVEVRTTGLAPNGVAQNTGGVPMNVHGDWEGQYVNLIGFSCQGRAEAFGGIRPMATAAAEAHGTVITQPWSFGTTALAMIDYFTRVRPINVPPNTFPYVPAYIFIRGHATGYASSMVTINYIHHHGVTTTTGTQQYDLAVPTVFDPVNSPTVNVRLAASAGAYEFTPNRPHSSEAVADPLFVFDQAAFDDLMGPDTFPLADYFEFEYSLGIIEMPPDPCDPDYDLSGSADQDDVVYLINVIAGGDNPSGRDPDFDLNGTADQDDVVRLIDVVAGAGC